MYAIIETGSHQFQVKPETVIEVNRLPVEAGQAFETDKVLLLGDEAQSGSVQIGTPYVSGAKVKGTVLEHMRGPKIRIFKMKRRKGYRRRAGHRQELTRVRIDSIES